MDPSTESGTLPTHSTFGEAVMEQDGSRSDPRRPTEGGGIILLQLLEFKTHLLEVVEELHIRRDAETRFEDQISKLVLEKQELEWEKESLQHQFDTVSHQHTDSLTSVKKEFQVKLRSIEEEKGKYQVTAELKDKEINNLKEELKSLQLLKYNLEKKSSELEQKLSLQIRSKDSHLNQLGEVEKRFSALSRQCAVVRQAHEKLEHNVDEAMRINKKLTSANEKQEATIVSLKKELDEVSNKLIKVRMTSVRLDKSHSPAGREQQIQQLLHKLNMETEMNKKLREENVSERAEKQEVMRALQHSQQLLLSQTQTVRRVEVELQTHRDTNQALKQEHEVMREKSKATEDEAVQLMESYAASRSSWDKEKTRFLHRIRSEQEELQAAKEAYDDLHQKHTELSSKAKTQAQVIHELEMRDSSQSLCVSTQLFPTLEEETRGEETLNDPTSSSELLQRPSDALQHSISSQAKNPDCLEDTGRGQKVPNHHHQKSEFKHPLNAPNMSTGPLMKPDHFQASMFTGTFATETSTLNKTTSDPSERDSDVVSDLIINTSFSDGLQISEVICVSGTTASSNPGCRSLDGSVNTELLSKDKTEEVNRGEKEEEQGEKHDDDDNNNNREEEERNTDHQRSEGDVKEAEGAGETRGAPASQTAERGNRATEGGETSNPETETKDREDTDGEEERAQAALHMPETQIPTQTTADTETSLALRVSDFMDSEPPLTVCTSSLSLSHRVSEEDSGRLSRGEVHAPCLDVEVQHLRDDAESLQHRSDLIFQPTHEKPAASQTNDIVQEAGPVQAETCDPPETTASTKQTDETCDAHVEEESVKVTEAQPQSEESSEGEKSVEPDDEGGDGHTNADMHENSVCEKAGIQSDVKHAPDLGSEVETNSCQEPVKTDADVKPSQEDDRSSDTSSLKLLQQPPVRQTLPDDSAEPSPLSRKTHGPLFEWGAAQRKTLTPRTKSDLSTLHPFVQGSSVSEQNPSGPGGSLGPPPSSVPTFLRSKQHNRGPLVTTRTSDLLNASGVCGTAASSRRHRQGETVEDVDSSRSVPVSTSSSSISKLSWLSIPLSHSRAPTSAAGPSSESDCEPSCSQEREEQQSSLRAHISKIQQFLSTERLRLPKRPRTDD